MEVMRQTSVISARGLSKVFPDGTVALKDFDVEIPDKSFFTLLGPSGCGKSTLLSLIGELGGTYEGELTINNKPPDVVRKNRGYGIVFQAPTLLNWRTARENVSLPLEVIGVNGSERKKRVSDVLDLVGLSDFRDHYPWQLSGGMQQRVAIARALIYDPAILLMDEPFGALDEITRERMNNELLRIWNDVRKTVVFVTHSIPEAAFLSTHIAIMTPRPGRIREVIYNDLPYPRLTSLREDDQFFLLMKKVRTCLESK